VQVIPGRYDVEYEHLAGGSILPVNPRALLVRDWDVAQAPSRTIDIPSGRYFGALRLNGEPFPETAYDTGDIYAVPLERERSPLLLGHTHQGAYDRPVLPGHYQPAYAHVAGGTIVPRNNFTRFGPTWRVRRGDDEQETPELDLFAAEAEVSYTHNGVPMPEGGPGVYRVHLQRGRNYLRLLDSSYGPFEWNVMEGRFDLFYEYRAGSNLPRNAFMRFGCVELVGDRPPSGGGGGLSR
jgi:hypothetical protein